ncbi:MAG: DotD/TraH family lipoprotein [Desulfobacteraceae bacterium]|nr:DotD/TraH family lipoprotein [Desulfobacteraceae bacterium]
MKQIVLLSLISLFLLFSGCFLSTSSKVEQQVQTPERDPCMEAIQEGTKKIHEELVKLARYQQQKDYKAIAKAKLYETPNKGPLSEPITLTWSGPIDKMLAMLAKIAGYKFPTPLGNPRFRDTIVRVDVMETPMFEVIENVGWQAGDRIAVILDIDRKIIRIAYKGD